ncbi:hypothetical protein Tco_0318257 [Tanacetum coccineum]
MDSIISLGQKNTLAEYMILSGADNRPPMLDKDLYDTWKSRMELYMQNREHGRMILESVEHGRVSAESPSNPKPGPATEDKVDSSKALDASLVDTESSGTALKRARYKQQISE